MGSEVTRTSGRPHLVKYAKTRILVVSGPDSGVDLRIAGESASVGSAADNDLVLHDDTVSRKHCEIESSTDGVRIRDIGSTNGILVSGVRIYDAVVTGPVALWLGDTQLSITPLEETVERLQTASDRFGDALGSSPRMRELFADLERIAATDLALLIEGETGTGKDVLAESVHRTSPRSEGPFVVFDCGAVAPSLAESELFGHERGAFTGAVSARAGVFEDATGGTLFLDELGELPKDLQPKLLRALEKQEIRRLGSTKTVGVDVRIIAATNRNLAAEVQRGSFREDLYFRLAATRVVVPPLRERMTDLPPLVEHFLSLEKPPRTLDEVSVEMWQMLKAHRWPGNVRELRNAVRRLLVTPERAVDVPLPRTSGESQPAPASADDRARSHASLERADLPIPPLRIARRDAGDAFEQAYLRAILAKTGGNVSRAASIAEVSRQMLQKLMRKHAMTAGVPSP